MSIRKIFTLIVSLMLATGCVAETDETDHYEDVAEGSDGAGDYSNGGNHWSSCNLRTETLTLELPDGTTATVTIPVVCDQRPYFDGGDPPPDIIIDPAKKVVNPYDNGTQLPFAQDPKF